MTDDPYEEIVINGSTISSDMLSIQVNLRENGISDATLIANDLAGKTYLGTLEIGSDVVVSFRFADEGDDWHTVFKGYVQTLCPGLARNGEVVSANCYGEGFPLKNCIVATEVGVDSTNPTQNTVGKAIRYVISNYVAKLFDDSILDHEGNTIASGYNIGTYCIDSISTEEFSYIEFKYANAFSCIQDLIKLAASSRYLSNPSDWVGLHWIVSPIVIAGAGDGPWFFLGNIGDHDVGALESYWPSHPLSEPLVIKSDMIASSFTREPFEANFIVVSGRYVYPSPFESYTEGNASEWHSDDIGAHIHDEEETKIIGDQSVYLHNNTGYLHGEFWFDIPHLDMSKIGTKNANPIIDFWVYTTNDNAEMEVRLWTSSDDKFSASITDQLESNKWVHITLDIDGPFIDGDSPVWEKVGDPDWSQITNIGFTIHGPATGLEAYIDGLQLIGSVVCCAYDSTHISTNGAKIMSIKDSLSSLSTIDTESSEYETCSLAQTALSELNRNKNDITSGQIVLPLDYRLMPGQIIHIHASQKADLSFQIDQDFRVTQVQHSFMTSGAVTILTLIDDLRNSVPRTNASSSSYNAIIEAVNPADQTKTLQSLKTGGDFDPKLTKICKDYPS